MGGPPPSLLVYFNDFQGGDDPGPEWSSSSISSTPLPADGSRKFLGRFGNETVSLTLEGLPAYAADVVEFDLYPQFTPRFFPESPSIPRACSLRCAAEPAVRRHASRGRSRRIEAKNGPKGFDHLFAIVAADLFGDGVRHGDIVPRVHQAGDDR